MVAYKTNTKQKIHMMEEGCANTDADSKTKQGANGQNSQNNVNKPINYFFSSSNLDADKRKGNDLMQKIHNTFGDVLMALGALKAHSLCSLSQTARHTSATQVCGIYTLKTIQGGAGTSAEDGHHHPSRGRWKQQSDVIALCWYPKQMVRLGYV